MAVPQMTGNYVQDLIAYRRANPTTDDPAWISQLAPEQAQWIAQNPGKGDNPFNDNSEAYAPGAQTPWGTVAPQPAAADNGKGLQYYVGANGAKVPIFQNLQQKASYFASLPDDRQKADFISQHQDLQQLVQQSMGTPAWNQWINHASTLASGGSNEAALANATQGVDPTHSAAYMAAQGLIAPGSALGPNNTVIPAGQATAAFNPSNTSPTSVGNTDTNPLNAAGNPNANMDDINYQKQLRQTAMDSQIYNPNGANTWGIQNSTAENLRGAFGGGVIGPSTNAQSAASSSPHTQTNNSANAGTALNPATGQPYQVTSDLSSAFGGALSSAQGGQFTAPTTPTAPAGATTPAPNPAPSYFGGNMTNNSTPTNTIGSGSLGAGGQLQGQNLQKFDWSTYDPSKA